jgi:hypothetical protein
MWLQIASQPIPAGVAEAEWLGHGEYRRWVYSGVSCDVRSSTAIEVDGVAATLTQNCLADAPDAPWNDALEVALVTEGRGYTIWIQSSADLGKQRRALERMLATIDLHPNEAAETTAIGGWTGIWPQTTLSEAEAGQASADAGDPSATWQLDPDESGAVGVARRFLREHLGWEAFMTRSIGTSSLHADADWGDVADLRFIRCAGGTNLAYPKESCAPANGNTFEHVTVRLEQLVRRDPTGIWIVTRWEALPGYTQTQPMSVDEARRFVEAFLDARVAGSGAEDFYHPAAVSDFPFLYATSDGAVFERFEVVEVGDPVWPVGQRGVTVRLFATDGTVVEQSIEVTPGGDGPARWDGGITGERPWLGTGQMTEDGEVVWGGGF